MIHIDCENRENVNKYNFYLQKLVYIIFILSLFSYERIHCFVNFRSLYCFDYSQSQEIDIYLIFHVVMLL